MPADRLGTLAAHVRRGFTLDGNFEAILDSQTKVHVTAVLDRTAVYEVIGAPVWYGRHLATLDRFTVDPEQLTYVENKNWNTRQAAAMRGRWAKLNGTESEDPPH